MNILFELLYNLSILISISIISAFIEQRGNKDWKRSLLQGVLLGSASVIGMLHPLVVTQGLIFDGRSVMISLSALFFGPLAATVAGIMALVLRIQQGGVGTIMGVLVIISSATFGTLYYVINKQHNYEVTLGQLLQMGLIVHITMILLTLTLPADNGISTMKLIGLPVLLSYPLATVLIGRIFCESKERRRTVEALRESQKKLIFTNQELNATMEELVATEEELRSKFEELQISEDNFRRLFEESSDAILIMYDNKFIDCNKATIELLNYDSKERIIGKSPWEISPEKQPDGKFSKEKTFEIIEATLNSKSLKFEWWQLKNNGTLLPVEIMMTDILLNGKKVFYMIWRDISERKQMEQRLEYLSYHDQLTGLYNRRFFEEELKRLDVNRNFPLSIVMADVNGLKLINDSFGHAMGDELIKRVADVIRKVCRADDIIARLGGDEFVILLPKTDVNEAEQIIKRINEMTLKEKVGSVCISVSYGCETKNNENVKMQEILKKAEDRMYKEKLFKSPSMRGKTINAIISTLHEKNKREEQHSHRVSRLCQSLGEAINLPEKEILELKTVGLLHDIGKIAIEENILNKPGKLTDDEWEEIKRHPEIGYRILSTVSDMSEMAEYVLDHHERWNGSGYPKGLKEEEIPLQSRIITIADAYDAMTSERSYRRVLSEKIAIEELKRNSGIQFDPELTRIFIEKVLNKPFD